MTMMTMFLKVRRTVVEEYYDDDDDDDNDDNIVEGATHCGGGEQPQGGRCLEFFPFLLRCLLNVFLNLYEVVFLPWIHLPFNW